MSAVKREVPGTLGNKARSVAGAVMGMTWVFSLERLVENC